MLETLVKWQLRALPASLWCARLSEAAWRRIGTHGDAGRWQRALAKLPEANLSSMRLGDCPALDLEASASFDADLRAALMQLIPWRKGPFRIGTVKVDAEWRSDLKWRRLSPIHALLKGARILDVGCGNGYYGWRMLEAGARSVVGIDHNPVSVAQHLAIEAFAKDARNLVLPVSLAEVPDHWRAFDMVFSMGVLSHSRDPLAHLSDLYARLPSRGTLVLESLVLARQRGELRIGGRYARMRNVWRLPGIARLSAWIAASGFTEIELLDVCKTSTDEQRRTEWMPFSSLAESLHLSDSSRTLEGLPAPHRAIFLARRP